VLDIHAKTFTLKEQLQVRIPLQRRVMRHLVHHLLQRRAPALDKTAVEPAYGLLLRRRRHHDARVVAVQRVVQPEKVTVASLDFELGGSVGFRGSL
jgi:hypothetical protein